MLPASMIKVQPSRMYHFIAVVDLCRFPLLKTCAEGRIPIIIISTYMQSEEVGHNENPVRFMHILS